ncbi:MAG: class I SAM-dependent methyltransferase, partial [Bacteroidia bacterium]|nr:class I SAM-dependent methyltransferase [Bacteroidia bacterium]
MSDVVYFSCPICQCKEYELIRHFIDGVTVGKCINCRMVYTPLRHPNPDSLFFTATHESLLFAFEPIISGRKKHYRDKNFNEYLQLINKYAVGNKLLDVGCAHGYFPFVAKKKGYDVTAVEPAKAMAKFASEVFKVNVKYGTIDTVDISDNMWDVVTFTDSLEYFPNPIRELKMIRSYMSAKGILFIKVPNAKYFSFRWRLSNLLKLKSIGESAYTPSLRVCHYDLLTLKKLVRDSGFTVLRVGSCFPIDSPSWQAISGYSLLTESPWWVGAIPKLLRRIGWALGKLQEKFA